MKKRIIALLIIVLLVINFSIVINAKIPGIKTSSESKAEEINEKLENETENKTENEAITSETEVDTTAYTDIKLYTLPSVDNMSLVGTNRGNWHDRQELGMYMPQGSSFEARIKNYTEFKNEIAIDVLNDDSQTEKEYKLKADGNWVKIEATADSVPFAKTTFGTDIEPIIEIKNSTNTKNLIKYTQGGEESKFFADWQSSGDKFAVIEGKSLTMLVPIKNINDIVHENASAYQFKTIDEMLKYYDDFTAQYDNFLGLEYNAKDHLNNNVKTKYFVKANKHGAGAAYYTGNHTAQNGDNISGYLSRGWLNLHEFGHGYQGTIANQELALGEVTNNVLGYYFQQTFLTKGDNGWMGDKQEIEKDMKSARDKATKFNDMNERQKLYVLVNVLDKLGPEKTWAAMNTDYRKLRSEGKSITTSDLFATEFSKQGYNVIPYLKENKIFPSDNATSEVYEQNLPMIFYLRDLVATDDQSSKIKKELNLKSDYDLVSTSDLKKYNLKGNLKITFDIDNIDEIKGKKAYIKDGKETIKEFEITKKEIELKDLPVGIYSIEVPMAKDGYMHEYEDVVVKENANNEKTIKYTKIENNVMASDDSIDFRGLGDAQFAKLNIDMDSKKINFVANNMQPHSYFTDEYAIVKIYDKDGNLIYEKDFIGNKSIGAINDNIDVDYGYKISIKHREAKTRLKFNSKLLTENDTYLETTNLEEYTNYIIGKNGLEKEGKTSGENYTNYKQKLDKYIKNVRNTLSENDIKNQYRYFKQKVNVLSIINGLNEKDKAAYTKANKDLLEIEDKTGKDDSKNNNTVSNNNTVYDNNTIENNVINNNTVENNVINNNFVENNITNNNNNVAIENNIEDNNTSKNQNNEKQNINNKNENNKNTNNKNSNTNKISNASKENNSSTGITKNVKNVDDSTKKGTLPKTGNSKLENIIPIIIIVMIITSIFAINKLNKMKF